MMGKKVIIQFLAAGLSGLLAFLTLSLSARLFGAQVLGEVAYITGLLGLVLAFSDLGLSRAHVHFTAANREHSALASFMTMKSLLLFLCVVAALTVGMVNRQLSWLFLVLLLFEVLFRLADSFLITFEGQEKAWPQNLVRLGGKLARLAAVVVLGLSWRHSLGFSLTFLAEAVLILALAVVISRGWWQWRWSKSLALAYIKYSLPFALIIPLSYLQNNGLILILNRFWSTEVLGVYAASFGLFSLLKSFSGSLMVFFFPRISRLNAGGDTAAIQRYTDMAVKFSLWLLLPLAAIMMMLAGPLVKLVLGESFAAGAGILRWLAAGVVVLAVFSPYDHVLFATKNHRPIVKVNLVTTGLVLVLGWLLVPHWAGAGAAMALTAGWLAGGIWQFLILNRAAGIKFLTDWRLTKSEVKYLNGLIHSFSQAVVRISRKKAGESGT